MFVALTVLATASVLTFSRGGMYNASGAALVGSLFFLRDRRARSGALLTLLLAVVIGQYFIVPRLDSFTGGALTARFASTDLTNRDRIVRADLQIWREHPWLGVGPGMASDHRETYFRAASAHTEFSRLLSEHGLLGFAALITLVMMSWRTVQRASPGRERATSAALVSWSFLFMLNVGMRLVAPGFLIGAAAAPLYGHAPRAVRTMRSTARRPRTSQASWLDPRLRGSGVIAASRT
jgi:O-antigen ligase